MVTSVSIYLHTPTKENNNGNNVYEQTGKQVPQLVVSWAGVGAGVMCHLCALVTQDRYTLRDTILDRCEVSISTQHCAGSCNAMNMPDAEVVTSTKGIQYMNTSVPPVHIHAQAQQSRSQSLMLWL